MEGGFMINEIYEFNREVLGADPRQMALPLDLPEQKWLLAALKEESVFSGFFFKYPRCAKNNGLSL